MKDNKLNGLSSSLFSQFDLPYLLVKNLAANGLSTPKPIQEQAIPPMLRGHDILGIAQTGSGKTLAFSLPLLAKIVSTGRKKRKAKTVQALVLAPTRELAIQIEEVIRFITRNMHLSIAVVFGGVSRLIQIKSINRGVDILIATPGRLVDHIREANIDLSQTSFLVLDEADRMLDMGFIRDVRYIASLLAPNRQTALFSATMPKEIIRLAKSLLRNPIFMEMSPKGIATEITQSLYLVATRNKKKTLAELLKTPEFRSVIIFTRTKYGADSVNGYLERNGYRTAALHGNKSQNARQRALKEFRGGNLQILVATDIAARGIDVPGISHVINYELPDEAESYVHRIGRTGRNGFLGHAITLYDETLERERIKLRAVERVIGSKIIRHHSLEEFLEAILANLAKTKKNTEMVAKRTNEMKGKERNSSQSFEKFRKRENFQQDKSFAKVA